MRTSHKLTRLLLALTTLMVFSALALAQNPPAPENVGVSDQKAGSLLVWPYYISSTGQVKSDTRISMTNTSGYPYATVAQQIANLARVHVFLMNGATCTQADLFVCLTPNATATFKTSEYDPDNSGYVIAVTVDQAGRPVSNNVLIGNAFVNDSTGVSGNTYEGNYGAEAFRAGTVEGTVLGVLRGDGTVGIVWGTDVDRVPNQFAVEVQHPGDSIGQRIVVAGLLGNLSTGALGGCAQVGTGQAFNQDEKFASFQAFLSGTCLCRAVITSSAPRVPGGLGALFGPAGQGRSGSLKFNVTGGVGLIMTPRVAGGTTNAWSGIRTLHKTTTTTSNGFAGDTGVTRPHLQIPMFIPVC